MGWVYAYGGKSLFLAIVLHAMDNTCWKLFPNKGSHYNPAVTAIVLGFLIVPIAAFTNAQRIRRSSTARTTR